MKVFYFNVLKWYILLHLKVDCDVNGSQSRVQSKKKKLPGIKRVIS